MGGDGYKCRGCHKGLSTSGSCVLSDLELTVHHVQVLLKNHTSNVVLIRENPTSRIAVSTFDLGDLNAYLLVVVGLAQPDEEHIALYDDLAKKAQSQISIPIRDIQSICRKETLVTLQADDDLVKAIEVLGSGIHRVLVANSAKEIVGTLSQLKLVEFFWNEGVNFRAIDEMYTRIMRDLGVGSKDILAVK